MVTRANTNPSRSRPPRGPALVRSRIGLSRLCAGGAGLALGAAGAVFMPRLAGWLGGGVAAFLLASLAGLLLVVVSANSLVRLAGEPWAVLRLFAGGPLAGALAGWLLWRAAEGWSWRWPADVLGVLGLRWDAVTCAAAGALAGWLAAALLDGRDHVLVGAAAGMVPGAMIGLRGDWGVDAWFAAPVVAALVMLLMVRLVLVAWAYRWAEGAEDISMPLRAAAALAMFGSVLCGLAPSAARWLSERPLWPWLQHFLVDLLSLPGAICSLLAFEPGWLGGAMGGAVLGAFGLVLTTTFEPERRDGPQAYPPVELIVGAVLGLIDGYFGSPVLRAVLANWMAGAASGAVVGVVVFAAAFAPERLARLFGLAVVAGGAGTLLWWLAQRDGAALPAWGNLLPWWLPGAVGAAAGWLATRAMGPEMLDEMGEGGRGPEAHSPLGLRWAGVGVLAVGYVFFPYAVRAVHAARYLVNGTVHAAAGRHARAAAEATRAEKINPHPGLIYMVRSRANCELGQYDWAIEDQSRLLAYCVMANDQVEELLYRGALYEAKRDHAHALQDCHAACKLRPHSAEALARRGGVLRELKRPDLAEPDLRAALALDPNHAAALETLAWCLIDQQSPHAALEQFERVVTLKPERAHAYYGRGWALLRMGESARALGSFQTALRLEPRNATYRLGVAWARHNSGEHAEAIADATAAIALEPANAEAFDLRGRCHEALGDLDRALEDYSQAARLDPADPDPRVGMANVYRRRQDAAKASEADALAERARSRQKPLEGVPPEQAAQVSQARSVDEIVSILSADHHGS